jgi:hypothetical protein
MNKKKKAQMSAGYLSSRTVQVLLRKEKHAIQGILKKKIYTKENKNVYRIETPPFSPYSQSTPPTPAHLQKHILTPLPRREFRHPNRALQPIAVEIHIDIASDI